MNEIGNSDIAWKLHIHNLKNVLNRQIANWIRERVIYQYTVKMSKKYEDH